MLLTVLQLIVFIVSFKPMNLFKDSLFSSSTARKTRKPSRNHSNHYRFQQANNSSTDPLLYTFDNNDIELGTIDSDEESQANHEHNVRTRHARPTFKPAAQGGGSIVIVEKPILPNETMQAFAIRYRVPVSQLKRLNNLQSDQDFYALTHCRIPVQRFGVLHEASSSTIVDLNEQSTISLPVTHLSQQNHHAFLSAMDQDLALMRTKVEQLIDTPATMTTAAGVIPDPSKSHTSSVTTAKSIANELNCDGADCGCRLWHIVLIIILIALIPFVFAYFYIKSVHNYKP